jgi:glycosyltransferase involved in cell wall biosynthesis
VAIANQMAKAGHRCVLVVSGGSEVPFPLDPSVDVLPASPRSGASKIQTLGRLWALATAVPRDTEVLVASYYLTAYVALAVKGFNLNLKLVYIIQGYEPNYFRQVGGSTNWASFFLAKLSYRLPFVRTAISRWLAEVLAGNGIKDVVVVNNGIDNEVFFPAEPAPAFRGNCIMTVGHRRPNRGYFDFCKAANLLWVRRKDFKVLVMGGDPGLAGFLDPPHEHVTVASDESLVALYRSATIFVTCSHEEGFGLTPLEAMACGTAVACTDSGGILDYAEHGVNCLMVPPRECELMADAMEGLIVSPGLRKALVQEGKRTAARFAWDVIGESYATVFENLESK